jgi:hypothetical protein
MFRQNAHGLERFSDECCVRSMLSQEKQARYRFDWLYRLIRFLSLLNERSITLFCQAGLQKAAKKRLYAIRAFPEKPESMKILTQVPSGMPFTAIRCSAYFNLFLHLTEEG